MLTRAYYATMSSILIPFLSMSNAPDWNISSLNDENIFNAKDINGNIRVIASSAYITSQSYTGFPTGTSTFNLPPFSNGWSYQGSSTNTNILHPDENPEEPSFEDYSGSSNLPTGWTYSSGNHTSKVYNQTTHEWEITVGYSIQNTSGSSKTVYGLRVQRNIMIRSSATTTSSTSTGQFVIARERFDSPVVVAANGILQLDLTYSVGYGLPSLSARGST